jgi:hypothetical protein
MFRPPVPFFPNSITVSASYENVYLCTLNMVKWLFRYLVALKVKKGFKNKGL